MVYHIGRNKEVARWSTNGMADLENNYHLIEKEFYDFQLPLSVGTSNAYAYPELTIMKDSEIEYCSEKYSSQIDRVSTFKIIFLINYSSD